MKRFNGQPFTLALSSGFFGFYAHVGFLKALEELHLVPSAYTGASAGSIVAAAAARGMTVKETEKLILEVSRKDFWDPFPGFGLLRGQKLQRLLEREIGTDFKELSKPLRISTFDVSTRTTKVFTSGSLAPAIHASCAVPVMFHPVKIESKYYYDGGIQDKMAIHGIHQDEKILSHYLESSRKDPHAIYEFKRDEKSLLARKENLLRVQLASLPRAHPFAMNRGPEIIKAAHLKALEELKKTL